MGFEYIWTAKNKMSLPILTVWEARTMDLLLDSPWRRRWTLFFHNLCLFSILLFKFCNQSFYILLKIWYLFQVDGTPLLRFSPKSQFEFLVTILNWCDLEPILRVISTGCQCKRWTNKDHLATTKPALVQLVLRSL